MSIALRVHAPQPPEFEVANSTSQSVEYLEHGFPSHLVRWHYHDNFELHLIVASTGKAFVGDYIGGFGPGNLVLTGPRLPHNWISQTGLDEVVELRDLVIQFRKELIPGMVQFAPELNSILPLLERARHGIEFRSVDVELAKRAFRQVRDASGAQRIACLLDLLDTLAAEQDYALLSTLAIRSRADQASQEKIQMVTQHIIEHYASDVTLSEMAKLVGMNESSFSRFFSKSTGNSFVRFVNRVRISKACELLAETDQSITSICFETGFNNVANFNRRFRELRKTTPRDYRRQSRLRHTAPG